MPISKMNLLLMFKVNCYIVYWTDYICYFVVTFWQSLVGNPARRESQDVQNVYLIYHQTELYNSGLKC
jgi:hypothetical protein